MSLEYSRLTRWECPGCGICYFMKYVNHTRKDIGTPHVHCNKGSGCDRYFDLEGNDITELVTRGRIK